MPSSHQDSAWKERLSPSLRSFKRRYSVQNVRPQMGDRTCSTSTSRGTELARHRHGIRPIQLLSCAKGRSDMHSKAAFHLRKRVLGVCLALLSISFTVRTYAQSPANSLPAGTGRDLVAAACTQCHGLKMIVALRDGPAGWKHFVDDMILRGAQLTPQEADSVTQYLSKNFGPGTSPMQSGLKSEPLPSGDGEKLVESHCALCHDLGRITNVATPAEVLTMASYLAAHFGKKSD